MKISAISTHVEYGLKSETENISMTIRQEPRTIDAMSDTELIIKLHTTMNNPLQRIIPYNEGVMNIKSLQPSK